jgi:hypothetical protein
MDTSQKERSYFSIRLQELLNASFLEKAKDSKFIEERCSWAAKAYEDAFRSGNTIEQCNEVANLILFKNLHFSAFDTVFQVVCQEFDTLMADEALMPFTLKILAVCEPVFARYELTDDFAYSVGFDLLYTEIVGTIAIWIEENGLQ